MDTCFSRLYSPWWPVKAVHPLREVEPLFESPEHQAIGDSITLHLEHESILGRDLQYPAGGQKLSFGEVIALAGDYFYQSQLGDCVEAVSDQYEYNPEHSIGVFHGHADTLRKAKPEILTCVKKGIAGIQQDVRAAVGKGQDPVQSAASGTPTSGRSAAKIMPFWRLVTGTISAYRQDAIKAYQAGHTAALRQAMKASQSRSADDLKEAYFLEGYAQHFLTDLSSAGHVRTLRRILHSTYLDPINVQPGDKCNRMQHDEDSANGLWVTNKLGQSWAVYGDKQLVQGRSGKNFQYAVEASQLGVGEIWETYESGLMPNVSSYRALKKAPVFDIFANGNNFVPLFERDSNNPNKMYFRKSVDSRAARDLLRDQYPIGRSHPHWKELYDAISISGTANDRYAFTRSFAANSTFAHIGDVTEQPLWINIYGNVAAGDYGNSWGNASSDLRVCPERKEA
ncbi:hypothetical protein MMC17_008578 [Xylographa soralifera]|nr:hypothetical protein [Xylographa soralifera]